MPDNMQAKAAAIMLLLGCTTCRCCLSGKKALVSEVVSMQIDTLIQSTQHTACCKQRMLSTQCSTTSQPTNLP